MEDEALSRMSLSEIYVAIAKREVSSQEARIVLLKKKILGPTLKFI